LQFLLSRNDSNKINGHVYYTTIYEAGLNRWWRQDRNQKRGKLEQNLSHLYSVQEMKRLFIKESAPIEELVKTTPVKKENKLN